MTVKLNTAAIKQVIADHVKNGSMEIVEAFIGAGENLDDPEIIAKLDPGESDIIRSLVAAAKDPKNWTRVSKRKGYADPTLIERVFDLKPAGDEIRAYVFTNTIDTQVVKLYIVGE
jgi:hypothetical protein